MKYCVIRHPAYLSHLNKCWANWLLGNSMTELQKPKAVTIYFDSTYGYFIFSLTFIWKKFLV